MFFLCAYSIYYSGDKSEYTAFITLLPKLRIDEARLFDHIREIPGISEINKLDI